MSKPVLNVALVGYSFMGRAHSNAYRQVNHYFDLPFRVVPKVIVGRSEGPLKVAAEQLGWEEYSTDIAAVLKRDDIHLVDVSTPNDSHAPLSIAALKAGKHVLCEKPMSNTVAEAVAMTAAAEEAATKGVLAMVGYTYRRVPAATFARDLVAAGKIGEVQQVRASYLQDWLVDPTVPRSWRLQKELAGSGALGDIGAHAIDLAQFVTGLTLTSVSGTLETIIKERPLEGERTGITGTAGEGMGAVTVDDVALFTGRFDNGALGSFEATRFSTGRKNALRLEVSGSTGAISFDLEDLNSLGFYDSTAPATEQGFTRIYVTEPQHPYLSAWWPAGHMLGYEHGFSHQAKDFVEAIVSAQQPTPSFADALQVQRVLAAVEISSGNGSAWTSTN